MTEYFARLDAAQPTRDKAYHSGYVAMFLGIPIVALWPINRAVEDDAWSVAILAVQLLGLAVQIGALIRSTVLHRRANKIMDGAA